MGVNTNNDTFIMQRDYMNFRRISREFKFSCICISKVYAKLSVTMGLSGRCINLKSMMEVWVLETFERREIEAIQVVSVDTHHSSW